MLLTKELLDFFIPQHGRTTCSDINPFNDFRGETGYPQCNRCYLLKYVGEEIHLLNVVLKLEVEPKYTYKNVTIQEVVRD